MEEFTINLNGEKYVSNDETSLGEPSLTILLSDNTSIEVTHEEDGLSEEEQYFSIRHHCSDEDFNEHYYHSTMGIIEQYVATTTEETENIINLMMSKIM